MIGRDRAHPAPLGSASAAPRHRPPPAPRWPWPGARSTEGLALYRVAVDELAAIRFPGMGEPTGLEPWALFGESLGVTALAVHGTTASDLVEGARPLRGAAGQVAARCSTRTVPSWTTRSPGWCCTGSAPGGCSATRCRPRTPCGCSCWPSCSATPGSPPTMSPRAPRATAEERAPGLAARLRARLRRTHAPPACCRRRGPSPVRIAGR